jgi:hypothetical protein
MDREQEDVRDEPHGSRLGGEAGQQRERLDHLERREQVVVAHGDGIEAVVARRPHLVDELAHLDARVLAGHELRVQDQAELHRAFSALQRVMSLNVPLSTTSICKLSTA